jgi:hypothetical protein
MLPEKRDRTHFVLSRKFRLPENNGNRHDNRSCRILLLESESIACKESVDLNMKDTRDLSA